MRTRRRPILISATVVAAVAALVVGAALFQPWRLLVQERADEALPADLTVATSLPSTAPESNASRQPSPAPRPSKKAEAPGPRVIRSGKLISHEHPTSGRVRVIELADGRRVLRLEDLATSSGPDLRVWLSAGPVVEGRRGWFVFARHPHVELGKLKANLGNQNYLIPADADLDDLESVTIWCRRFRVSFGAAALS